MAELPLPLATYQDGLVENVFPMPQDPEQPDMASLAIAQQYLRDRYAGPPPEGIASSYITIPVEESQTTVGAHWVWPRGDEPHDYPVVIPTPEKGHKFRRWLNANIIGLLLVNVAFNIDQVPNLVRDGIESVRAGKDIIEDKLLHTGRHKVQHVEYTYHTGQETVPGHTVTSDKMFSHSQVGEVTPEPSAVEQFFTDLKDLQGRGVVIEKSQILGESSDDWHSNPDCDLGVISNDNANLAAERAQAFKKAVTDEAAKRGITLPELEIVNVNPKPADIDEAEKRLSTAERQAGDSLAQQNGGYPDFCAAIGVYKTDPDSLPPILREFIDVRIGNRRGASLVFQGRVDDQVINIVVPDVHRFVTNDPDGSPNNKHKYDLDLVPFFFPPIPGGHLRPGTKTVMKEIFIDGVEGEDEWLRIYEEGVNPDGTLKKEAWAYTRIYQVMFRDDRIKHVYNLEYVDADGGAQNMRILFADHTPHVETIANFPVMLQSVIQMDGGSIGHNLDAIVVYAEENAGTEGRDPKRIGLGIDYQSDRNILGTAYYSLGLVEMHMPANPTQEDMHGQLGALWTFTHETAGHFIDHNQEPAKLTAIDSRAERHFVVSKQQGDLGKQEYERLRALDRGEVPRRRWRDIIMRRPVEDAARRWFVRVGFVTNSNTVHREDNVVLDNNPLLRRALSVRLENRFPTRYSRTSRGEFWAESAAQAVTRIGIPFSEQQPAVVDPPEHPNFATTYGIGTRMLRYVQDVARSNAYADGIEWRYPAKENWVHTMTTVANDPHLGPLARQARIWDFRHQDDPRVYNILVRARRSQR